MPNRRPERLGEFVRRTRNKKGLSLLDVSKRGARFGPRISGSYINRIERNPKLRVTPNKLKALAFGLGVPVEEMLAHALKRMSANEADDLLPMDGRVLVQCSLSYQMVFKRMDPGQNDSIQK